MVTNTNKYEYILQSMVAQQELMLPLELAKLA